MWTQASHRTEDMERMVSTYHDGESDTRPWGHWEVLSSASDYVVKRIVIRPGQHISLQRHAHRSEHWVVIGGIGLMTLGTEHRTIHTGEQALIHCGELHRIENIGDGDLVFIEVQLGTWLSEDDIERLADESGPVAPP